MPVKNYRDRAWIVPAWPFFSPMARKRAHTWGASMKKALFGLAAVLVIAGASSLFIGASKPEAPKSAPEVVSQAAHVKWEYKIAAAKGNNADQVLNSAGEEGWELVAMAINSSGLTFNYNLVFKRPKN
jgi:hypothetical protein